MSNFFKKKNNLPLDREYFLSLLSGFEGGLATTSAIVAGLVISGVDEARTIVTISVISFAVQAFNSSVSRFSGEHTSDEIDNIDEIEGYRKPLIDGILQFISHVSFSLLILIPFLQFNDIYIALASMVGLTFLLMFCIGVLKAFIVHNGLKKDGLEMVYLSLLVMLVGSVAGLVVR